MFMLVPSTFVRFISSSLGMMERCWTAAVRQQWRSSLTASGSLVLSWPGVTASVEFCMFSSRSAWVSFAVSGFTLLSKNHAGRWTGCVILSLTCDWMCVFMMSWDGPVLHLWVKGPQQQPPRSLCSLDKLWIQRDPYQDKAVTGDEWIKEETALCTIKKTFAQFFCLSSEFPGVTFELLT